MPATLAEIVARDVPRRWFEVVAVVQELADVVEASALVSRLRVPELSQAEITPAGGIKIHPGSPSDDHPVTALARILHALLAADAPAQLRLFVTQSASSSPQYDSVHQFSEALAYYERQNRVELIKGLYERWRDLPATPAVPVPEPTPETVGAPGTARGWRTPAAIAVAVLAIAGASIAFLYQQSARSLLSSARAGTEAVVKTARSGVSAATGWIGLNRPGDAQPGSDPQGADSSGTPMAGAGSGGPESERLSRNRDRADSVPSKPLPAGTVLLDLQAAPQALEDNERSKGIREAIDRASQLTSGDGEPNGSTSGNPVYTVDNLEVTPPALIRPQLPSTPPDGMRLEDLGVFELVVATDGTVESAKLRSRSNRFNEKMLVSAAKTWRFSPALRDGRPVRYRKLIFVTVP